MARDASPAALTPRQARAAPRDALPALVHSANDDLLEALLENPRLDESHLVVLLERKELSGRLLEQVGARKAWLESYAVRLRLARHPHAPRLLALRLLRQLHLFDLANVSLLPSTPAEVKRLAEELILARLAQVPLGQKLTLARRGSGRVAAALLLEGQGPVVPLALDNALLAEAQVLKVLARDDAPAHVVQALAQHAKWSRLYAVRLALVRHPLTPLARVLCFLPELNLGDLDALREAPSLPARLREYLQHEIAARARRRRPRVE